MTSDIMSSFLVSVLYLLSCYDHLVSSVHQCEMLAANNPAAINPIDENPYLLLKGHDLSLVCCGFGLSDIQWYDYSGKEIKPLGNKCHITNIFYKHKSLVKSNLEIFTFMELGQQSYICKNENGKYMIDFHVIEMKTTKEEIEQGLFRLECRLLGIPHNRPSTEALWVLPNGQEGYSQSQDYCLFDDFCISLTTSKAGRYRCIFKLPTASNTSKSFEAHEDFIVPNNGTPRTSSVAFILLLLSISFSCFCNVFKDSRLILKRCID